VGGKFHFTGGKTSQKGGKYFFSRRGSSGSPAEALKTVKIVQKKLINYFLNGFEHF